MRERIFEVTPYGNLQIYKCYNNVAVLLLKDPALKYLYLTKDLNKVVKKNEAFIEIEGKALSLPFRFGFIEKHGWDSDKEYIGIIFLQESSRSFGRKFEMST